MLWSISRIGIHSWPQLLLKWIEMNWNVSISRLKQSTLITNVYKHIVSLQTDTSLPLIKEKKRNAIQSPNIQWNMVISYWSFSFCFSSARCYYKTIQCKHLNMKRKAWNDFHSTLTRISKTNEFTQMCILKRWYKAEFFFFFVVLKSICCIFISNNGCQLKRVVQIL